MSAAPVSLPAQARADASATVDGTEVAHLWRLRWAVRAVLTLGVAASIAANVLHARPNLISQLIAAWPPLALLLTVELISRVPAHRRSLAVLRLLAAAVIAGIAAWVSYWHMTGVAARYGETDAAASYLLPVSVDGLVVVASISLVEIAGRIRASRTETDLAATSAEYPTAGADQPPGERLPAPADPPASGVGTLSTATTPTIDVAAAGGSDRATSYHRSARELDDADGGRQRRAADDDSSGKRRSRQVAGGPLVDAGPVRVEAGPSLPADTARRQEPVSDGNVGEGAVPSDTAAAVAFWYRRDPSMHPAEVAAKIGRSERTVRRYWPSTSQRAANGHETGSLADRLRAS